MYQIFDCFGKPVGRAEGYEKHSTASGLITRQGAIRRAIFDAYDLALHDPTCRLKLLWAIRWIEGDNHA